MPQPQRDPQAAAGQEEDRLDALTPQERLEEWVAAYFLSKTGREGTPAELAELASAVPPETRDKLEAMHLESVREMRKASLIAESYMKQAEGGWNQAWLVVSGICVGLLARLAGDSGSGEDGTDHEGGGQSRRGILHLDRTRRPAVAQKLVMVMLVGVGTFLAVRRYRRLVIRPWHPSGPLENRMALALTANVVVLMRLAIVMLGVTRDVPWWEALATGFGMLVLQPLFMGLCAQPILRRHARKLAKDTAGENDADGVVDNKKMKNKDGPGRQRAALAIDVCCVAVAAAGMVMSTWSEAQRSDHLAAHPNTLYTGGLFSVARHINYTGEVVLFLGWAMLTRSRFALLVPCFFFASFHALYVPDLDQHLRGKHPAQFAQWQQSTPASLIPLVL